MLDKLLDDGLWLFTIPAIAGSAVFILKLVLMSIAGGIAGDLDTDIGADFDIDAGAAESTLAFEWLSVQTISGFLMGFGGGGLVGRFGLGWDMPASIALAVGMGVGTVWLIVWMMRAMYSLQSSGNINLADAVGRDGIVYARIPPAGEGRGQVRVIIGQRMRLFAAVSEAEAFESQAAVRIVRSNGDNTLTVTARA